MTNSGSVISPEMDQLETDLQTFDIADLSDGDRSQERNLTRNESDTSRERQNVNENDDNSIASTESQPTERRGSEDESFARLDLPPELDPDYYGDFTHQEQGRVFRMIVNDALELPESGHGDDRILCEIEILENDVPTAPRVRFQRATFLWSTTSHQHFKVTYRPDHLSEDEMVVWANRVTRDSLKPWQKYGTESGLEYSEPLVGHQRSQMKGISFPKIALRPFQFDFRILLLLPSFGDVNAPLRASLIVSPLYLHSCYIAIRNSRGNPATRGEIIVDGKMADITKNMETFLRHVRLESGCLALWIRDICVNREDEQEVDKTLTVQYTAMVENCSCGIIDMSKAMAMLDAHGCLPGPKPSVEKNWDGPYSGGVPGWHIPVALQKYVSRKREGLTEADVSQWPDYEYVPLDVTVREIRLLNIYPPEGPDENVIAVDVSHCPIYDNVRYYALSYRWGSEVCNRYIRDDNSKIAVTENLYAALLQLRSLIVEGGGPVVCWTDAICINQKDKLEKSRQLALMHDIYDNAQGVMTSLGPDSLLPIGAIDFLENHVVPWNFDWFFMNGDSNTGDLIGETDRLDMLADMYSLIRTEYFSRRWIIQELVSASHPMILLGKRQGRAYRSLSNAVFWLSYNFDALYELWGGANHPVIERYEELAMLMVPHTDEYHKGHDIIRGYFKRVTTLDYFRKMRMEGQWPSFLFLAVLTQHAQCRIPQDIINSLWNISKEKHQMKLPFDYNTDLKTSYTSFVQRYAVTAKSLDIICMQQPQTLSGRGTQDELSNLPSWCPDFRRDASVSSLVRSTLTHLQEIFRARLQLDQAPYHADKLSRNHDCPQLFRFEQDTLVTQGFIFDTVQSICPTPTDDIPDVRFDHQLPLWFWFLRRELTFSFPGVEDVQLESVWQGPEQQRIFVRTQATLLGLLEELLCMAEGSDRGAVTVSQFSIQDGSFSYLPEPMPWELDEEGVTAHAKAAELIRGRRLITTKEGRIGLAPWYVQKGYKIAVLCGCSVPVLLESVKEHNPKGATDMQPNANESSASHESSGTNFENNESSASRTAARHQEWQFRGDCFIPGFVFGEGLRKFGTDTEEAWNAVREQGNEIRIV